MERNHFSAKNQTLRSFLQCIYFTYGADTVLPLCCYGKVLDFMIKEH